MVLSNHKLDLCITHGPPPGSGAANLTPEGHHSP
jgi:hypothetical protein